jgi:hypothetical protein
VGRPAEVLRNTVKAISHLLLRQTTSQTGYPMMDVYSLEKKGQSQINLGQEKGPFLITISMTAISFAQLCSPIEFVPFRRKVK